MATKPTDRILDWASGGTTTDPGGSKEAAGWLTSERPPAYWWNWILNSFGQWLSWAEDSIDETLPKAVVRFTMPATTAGSPAIEWSKGVGITSITFLTGNDGARITFDDDVVETPIASSGAIVPGSSSGNPYLLQCSFSGQTAVDIEFYDDTGTKIDWDTVGNGAGDHFISVWGSP